MISDEKLMLEIKRGVENSLTEIYSRYKERVWGYCYSRLPEKEAKVLYQKIWFKLIETRENYLGQPFAPWLYVLVREQMIHDYRMTHFIKIHDYHDALLDEIAKLDEYSKSEEVEKTTLHLDEFTKSLIEKHYLKGFSYDDLLEDIDIKPESKIKKVLKTLNVISHGDEE
jgi:RNA polymerase sigma factor (sigma-70 family)